MVEYWGGCGVVVVIGNEVVGVFELEGLFWSGVGCGWFDIVGNGVV